MHPLGRTQACRVFKTRSPMGDLLDVKDAGLRAGDAMKPGFALEI